MNGKQLKNSILQWAIQGKLVPQDPNDEPASVLLERIREEKARLVKEKKIKKDKNESIIFRGDDNSHYEKFADGTVKCIDDEIPFEIPTGWSWERWGNISFSIQYGYNAPAIEKGDIKMVRISDIHDNKVKWENVPYCKISPTEIGSYLLQENDILFARTGGTVGKSFLMGKVSESAIYAGYLIRTRYSAELCPQYLKYFMESSLYWEQLRSGTIATAQPNCNGKTLGRMLLPIPPQAEQIRIINKLQTIESPLAKYLSAQEILDSLNTEIFDKLKKSVLQEAIQGKLVPQDPNDEPASVLLERIKEEKIKLFKEGKLKKKDLVDSVIFKGDDNKYYEKKGNEVVCIDDELPFEIPDSWEWCRLGNCVSYQNGYAYTSTELNKDKKGLPVIKSGNLMTYEVVLKSNNDYVATPTDKMLASMITKGDLLMCLSSQSDNPEPLGKTAIYKEETPALLNQRVLKMRPYINCILEYLYITINSEYFHYTVSLQSGGSAQANLKLEHVLNMLVPLPPLKEQKRIINKLEEINKGIED